ncbi:MAG: AAA family ATPase, partial [Gammaproteobacteria bacterium]|nr:AAA family ATPase [Gammaproteobacteria bacterium]
MTTDSSNRRRFEVALSFPGGRRDYVKKVAAHLASSLDEERVLYDKYHDAEFARSDLNIYLPKLYLNESELIVIFLCSEYATKHWCKLEWRYINQLITTADAKRIMFLSFGDPGDLSEIGILSGDGYIDVFLFDPKMIADKIIKRIGINDGVSTSTKLTQTDSNVEHNVNSKFHGKQRAELLQHFSTDWLINGAPVAVLQGFPGCGKTQLANAIAATAPRSLNPIEPQTDEQDPSLYLFIELADSLASAGIPDLVDELQKGANGDLFSTLLKVLRREHILIIIDEFQGLFSDKDTHPPMGWQRLIEKLNNSNRPAGRLLLISNRAIKKARWCEKCVSKELKGLTDSEATTFLQDLLESKDLSSKVPAERLVEICHRLGGNPRALMTLASSLFYDSLEDLLSLAPNLFKLGDVKLDHDLVEDFERELIERTLPKMEGELLKFMRYIAVHRRSFKKEALSEYPASSVTHPSLRKQLIERFLLVNTPSGDSMHPLAREISVTRLRDEKEEWEQAHSLAANYHFRHFKAIQMKGTEKCISSYSELRHHLFEAGRIDELYLASKRLAQFVLSQITKPAQSQIPVNVETLEERIALISALPEDQRPNGLEYHLALCLKHRNIGDDYQVALTHVRRAVGPNIYYAAWLLLIELEYSVNGVDAMINAQEEALTHLGSGSNAFAIYHLCANLLSKNNKLDAAINLLEKGISTPGVKCLAPLINQCSKYMEQTGRYDDAIKLLTKSIDIPSIPELGKMYIRCAKLMEKMNRSNESAELLKKGIAISGMTSLYRLYLALAELLMKDKRDKDAIHLLEEGLADARIIDK